jgi:hypothetical protein
MRLRIACVRPPRWKLMTCRSCTCARTIWFGKLLMSRWYSASIPDFEIEHVDETGMDLVWSLAKSYMQN